MWMWIQSQRNVNRAGSPQDGKYKKKKTSKNKNNTEWVRKNENKKQDKWEKEGEEEAIKQKQ